MERKRNPGQSHLWHALGLRSAPSGLRGDDMSNPSELDAKIAENVADALIYSDRSGTIMRWNGAATALFGFTAAEALGQNLDLIIPEHLRAAHWKGIEAALASGSMTLAGTPTLPRALHKSGRKLYIEM